MKNPSKASGELITGKHAASYDRKNWIWKYIRRKQFSYIDLQPGQSILDVGSGTSSTLFALWKKYGDDVKIFGVEPSKDMVAQGAERLKNAKNVTVSIASSEKLPHKANSLDYVLCSLVIHHLPMDVKQQALAEIYRVLKPGGTFVLTDWGKPTNVVGKVVHATVRDHVYVHENVKGILDDMMRESGFEEVKTRAVQTGIVHHWTAKKPL